MLSFNLHFLRSLLSLLLTRSHFYLFFLPSFVNYFPQITAAVIFSTYEENLAESGLTSLEERRHQEDTLQCIYKIWPAKTERRKNTDLRQSRTRKAWNEPRARLEKRSNFFSEGVADEWNNVPEIIKLAGSVGHLMWPDIAAGAPIGVKTVGASGQRPSSLYNGPRWHDSHLFNYPK
jgi:hypothetical protein